MKFREYLEESQKYCSVCHKEKAVKMGMCKKCYDKWMKKQFAGAIK